VAVGKYFDQAIIFAPSGGIVAIRKLFKKSGSKKPITSSTRSGKSSAKKSAKKPQPKKLTSTKAKKKSNKRPEIKVAKRSANIVKPQLAKKPLGKRSPGKPFPAKLQTSTSGSSTTISVASTLSNSNAAPIVEERRLVMPPPPKPVIKSKKLPALKPIKAAPAPLVVQSEEVAWSATELKTMRAELSKDLIKLQKELEQAEAEMEDLVEAAGVGAGDDQADAGAKTFEREHEMSLVYNARDMVEQTERALERINNKTYGKCEECGNFIGKARLQVFPRATLCMVCKQKEERR
jgi:RNA polymerase-binding transcription factor DksA